MGDETADTRSKGCTDALKAAGFSNIVEQPANNDRNTAMGVMENMLQSNDNIVAVYATMMRWHWEQQERCRQQTTRIQL